MKQTVVLALAAAVVGASANSWEDYPVLRARLFDSTSSSTHVQTTQSTGKSQGGSGKGGRTGSVRGSRGARGGQQRTGGSKGGLIGSQRTDMRGAQMGQTGGTATGGAFSGTLMQAAPMMFGGGMFDRGAAAGATFNGPSISGGIGSASAAITGPNRVSTGNNNDAKGVSRGGGQSLTDSGSSTSGAAGGGYGARGGQTGWGGGFSQGVKGGDASNSNDLSASIPLPMKRSLDSLHRRALELESEYTWIIQQKRDLEQSLVEREAEPEYEEFEIWSREAEPEDEDGLTARDLAEYYFLMASDY